MSLEHLFTEEELEVLDEAAEIASSLSFYNSGRVFSFTERLNSHEKYNKLGIILAKAQEKPFYWIHRRGDKADIFQKGKETKLIITIPCPLREESTERVLESVGIMHGRFLEANDFIKLVYISSMYYGFEGINLAISPEKNFRSFSSPPCDSLDIGRANLQNPSKSESYGDTEMETRKLIKLTAINGSVVTIPADMFADYLFTNPPLHKLLTQLIDKARNGKEVILSLDEYMTPRKLKDKRTAREQMKKLFDVLYEMSFGVRNEGFRDFRIIYDREYKDRIGERVVFTDPFLDHINDSKDGYLLNVPADFMPIENPTAYWIAVYANLHRLRNYGKPTQDIIKVGTLLRYLYLPIDTSGKSAKQIVIDPLRKGLQILRKELILTAELVYPGVEQASVPPESDDFLRAWEDLSFLESLNIRVHWLCNVPNYTVKS